MENEAPTARVRKHAQFRVSDVLLLVACHAVGFSISSAEPLATLYARSERKSEMPPNVPREFATSLAIGAVLSTSILEVRDLVGRRATQLTFYRAIGIYPIVSLLPPLGFHALPESASVRPDGLYVFLFALTGGAALLQSLLSGLAILAILASPIPQLHEIPSVRSWRDLLGAWASVVWSVAMHLHPA